KPCLRRARAPRRSADRASSRRAGPHHEATSRRRVTNVRVCDADGEHRVGEPGPGFPRPVAEVEVGQARERQLPLRIDPEEGPAAAEVAERARRVEAAGPVRALRVTQLEAEAPVVRLHAAEAGENAVEPGELHSRGFL